MTTIRRAGQPAFGDQTSAAGSTDTERMCLINEQCGTVVVGRRIQFADRGGFTVDRVDRVGDDERPGSSRSASTFRTAS